MRIAVTGAGGGLGRAFVAATGTSTHEVHAFTHADLDVGDRAAVAGTLLPLRPDVIVNAAAFADVDECEADPERAARDNALGPRWLALAAREVDAVLLHVSTDYVFDGEKGTPYDESDPPNPVNAYGRSKLAGEDEVRAVAPRHLVVRTAYLFGGGRDYFTSAVRRLARGEDAGGLVDRRSSPTFVRHLAERLAPLTLEVSRTGRFGTYHLAGPEPASWHELLVRAKALAGLPGAVLEQRADELALVAARPRDSSLASALVPGLAIEPMPSLDDALREQLGSL